MKALINANVDSMLTKRKERGREVQICDKSPLDMKLMIDCGSIITKYGK